MRSILDLYVSLYPARPEANSVRFYRIYTAFFAISLAGMIYFAFSAGLERIDLLYKASVLSVCLPGFVGIFGRGLAAGAFGRRFRRYGERIWAVSEISVIVIAAPAIVCMGYFFAAQSGWSPLAGALVGVALAVIIYTWGAIDLRKRYRRRNEETAEGGEEHA